ncbi:uncharacterized protein BXZ73DRAFT_99478 [Epithele typhae]|uniref:uncharacterized protein n=1 Tax=Epithele typhae TaxID=378194 RepID=UPI002008397D|nr:uncharacterized protein BXZ73DRAFT_99478 [Epithele typhae]KAH9939274.1 hypothetical protein BXZ73DRAFT_99478 [Epithele typhae]
MLSFTTLDVFTDKPFTGNQLAVVKVPAGTPLSLNQRAAIAREFNLSETVFIHEAEDGPNGEATFALNIHIEDGAEIPWAGHPTVGSGFFAARAHPSRPIVLRPPAGAMPVARVLDAAGALTGARVRVAADFRDHGLLPVPGLTAMQTALRADDYAGGSGARGFPVASIVKGMTFILVELASVEALGRLRPCATRVRPAEGVLGSHEGLVGLYAFVRLGEEGGVVQLRTRMLLGPMEDPATGSAASALSSWLSMQKGPGRWSMRITQGVEINRPSEIFVDVVIAQSGSVESVELSGSVCEVMRGELPIPEE